MEYKGRGLELRVFHTMAWAEVKCVVRARVDGILASYSGDAGFQISARISAVVIRDFRDSPQSIHTNAAIKATIASFNILSNSLLTSRPIIRHYVIWNTEVH